MIVGGGGHGLATAYYLAREHGVTNVAVVEKGWLGGGNTGRNTTIIRSNYLWDESARIYDHAVQLWEGLSQELNFNVMFSQRGVLHLAHTVHDLQEVKRRLHANRLNGVDSEFLNPGQINDIEPLLNVAPTARYPILGASLQRRGGTARHDAVAWGYARAADGLGVDIIQNCEVTGIVREGDRVTGVETTRGRIGARRIGIAVAGHTSRVAAMAGLRLPIESHLLQAMVTEPIKPVLDTVIRCMATHVYVSQTDKGELLLGGDLDGYTSYAQRGNLPMIEHVMTAGTAMMPCFGRLRLLRHWSGIMDMTMDGSPIIARTPIAGLYLNGGWCYGGFKATPASGWCFAHTIARNEPHALNAALRLDRFATGHLIDEKGVGAQPNLH